MAAVTSAVIGGISLANSMKQSRKASKASENFTPTNFASAGAIGTFANNRFTVSRGSEAQSALTSMGAGFAGQGAALREGATSLGNFLPGLQDLQRRLSEVDPVALSPELRALRGRLQGIDLSALSGAQGDLTGLRGEVSSLRQRLQPGFGAITRSRVEGLRDNRTRAVGNLREELSRRRVLGSSFAQREVSAMEADFTRQEDQIRAESMLQEIDATNQLIMQEVGIIGDGANIASTEAAIRAGLIDQETGLVNDEFRQHMEVVDREMQKVAAEGSLISQQAGIVGTQFETIARSFDTAIISAQQILAQLNLETGLASGLGESASSLIQANLTAQAQARSAQEAGSAEFLGTIMGMFFAPPPTTPTTPAPSGP